MKRLALAIVFVAAAGSGAGAQALTAVPPAEVPQPALLQPPVAMAPERADIIVIQQKIAELRAACAAVPPSVLSTQGKAPQISPREPPAISRPYAAEQSVCKTALDPERGDLNDLVGSAILGGAMTIFGVLAAYGLFRLLVVSVLEPFEGSVRRFWRNRELRRHLGTGS